MTKGSKKNRYVRKSLMQGLRDNALMRQHIKRTKRFGEMYE